MLGWVLGWVLGEWCVVLGSRSLTLRQELTSSFRFLSRAAAASAAVVGKREPGTWGGPVVGPERDARVGFSPFQKYRGTRPILLFTRRGSCITQGFAQRAPSTAKYLPAQEVLRTEVKGEG